MTFNKDSLKIDAQKVSDELCKTIASQIGGEMRKRGAIVGISGGIDSSVVAALCSKALGPNKVLGVMMPEKDSASESKSLAQELAHRFGFETVVEELTGGLAGRVVVKPLLKGGRYRRQSVAFVFRRAPAGMTERRKRRWGCSS